MEAKGNIHDHSMIREAIGYRVETIDEAIRLADVVLNGTPHNWGLEPGETLAQRDERVNAALMKQLGLNLDTDSAH
jgi:hypothetical protein